VRGGRASDPGPAQYVEILSDNATGKLPLVVGGQAVNLWALTFEKSVPDLASHKPFTSLDCDVVASQAWVRTIAPKHHLKYRTFRAGQASPAVGVIYIPLGSSNTEVQVLRNIRGLSQKELESSAVELLFDDKQFRVINPISLLKAKLANVVELDQTERQDVRHVTILTYCVCHFLKLQVQQYIDTEITARDCVEVCDFAARVISSENAARVAMEYDVDFTNVIPKTELMRIGDPKFENFLSKRLPSLGLA